MGGNIR